MSKPNKNNPNPVIDYTTCCVACDKPYSRETGCRCEKREIKRGRTNEGLERQNYGSRLMRGFRMIDGGSYQFVTRNISRYASYKRVRKIKLEGGCGEGSIPYIPTF